MPIRHHTPLQPILERETERMLMPSEHRACRCDHTQNTRRAVSSSAVRISKWASVCFCTPSKIRFRVCRGALSHSCTKPNAHTLIVPRLLEAVCADLCRSTSARPCTSSSVTPATRRVRRPSQPPLRRCGTLPDHMSAQLRGRARVPRRLRSTVGLALLFSQALS